MNTPTDASPWSLSLPVCASLSRIQNAVGDAGPGGFVVLRAEPGSGKTSLVPAALADTLQGMVVVTEPRRVAAIGAASFAARLRGEEPGQSIGYAVRGDRRWGPSTRVLYVTEGVALSLLCDSALVSRLGALVLDEFHERHATTDALMLLMRRWSLAVRSGDSAVPSARAQRGLSASAEQPVGPRFVLMSATFDEARLGRLLEPLTVIDVPGAVHPVTLSYEPVQVTVDPLRPAAHVGMGLWQQRESWEAVARVAWHELERSAREGGGAVLCFLPGKAEIQRVGEWVTSLAEDKLGQGTTGGLIVEYLHGDRPLAELMQAISTAGRLPCRYKLFLSTNIAESSLTIPGVRTVIDTGIRRIAKHHLASGTVELSLDRISQQSAIQRAGRAGREGPGRVVRLFSEDDFIRRPQESEPEICVSDLSRDLLDLLRCLDALLPGSEPPRTPEHWLQQPWLDAPPPDRLEAALLILRMTQAVDAEGRITASGQQLSALPLTVRLGRVALEAARRLQSGSLSRDVFVSCLVMCALLSEGDLQGQASIKIPAHNDKVSPHDSNALLVQWSLLRELCGGRESSRDGDAARKLRRVLTTAASLLKALDVACEPPSPSALRNWLAILPQEAPLSDWGPLFFCGYADAFAVSNTSQSLSHMGGETFYAPCVTQAGAYIVLEGVRLPGRSQSAPRKVASKVLPVDIVQALEGPADWLNESCVVERAQGSSVLLRARQVLRYGRLVIDEHVLRVDEESFHGALRDWLVREQMAFVLASTGFQTLLRRLKVLSDPEARAEMESFGDTSVVADRLASYLRNTCAASSTAVSYEPSEIVQDGVVVRWALASALATKVARLVPERLELDNGVTVAVDYLGDTPALVGRIQDFYGLSRHPQFKGSATKPLVRLLAPGGQTAQITADLPAFWLSSYSAVRKAYQGRYPKHHWPDDPATARPLLTKRQLEAAAKSKA